MRAYATLTDRGKTGRLRRLALEAMSRYGFATRSCRCAVHSFNTIFRVEAADGQRYALRVAPELRIHPAGTESAEVAWMVALRGDNVVSVPPVLHAIDGSNVLDVEVEGVPGPRRCVLFGWVPGRPIGERMTPARARRLGSVNALLHEQAAHGVSAPPRGIAIGDRVLYWSIPSRLEELSPVCGSLIPEARDRAQGSLDGLWRDPPHPPHLQHADLSPSNVILRDGRAVVLDFQDLIWGFEQQDLAITIDELRRYPEPLPLVQAFGDGYREIRPWPDLSDDDLDALIAARWIQQLNLGLTVRKSGLDAFIERHVARIRSWMDRA